MTRARLSPRLLLLALAFTAACGGPGEDSAADATPDGERALRVMSYNIKAGNRDLMRIAEVIREADPDLVGVQEVDVHFSARSDFVDQATALAEALGMHVRFAHIYDLPPQTEGAPNRRYGGALLSRYPIVSFENRITPRLSTVEEEPAPKPRPGILDAVVRVGETEVRVLNAHLDYRPDPSVREMQVEAILGFLDEPDRPTLLIGDLNARPEAEELQPLFEVLRDAWAGQEGPGHTFPSDTPERRIDYVLHSAHFTVDDAQVLETEASDHRPVLVEMRLAPGGVVR